MTETYNYENKGISQGAAANSDWVPVPAGRYRFAVESCRVKAPPDVVRYDKDGKEIKQKERVVYTCVLADEDARRVRGKAKLAKGQEQSITCWASFGYTWGWVDRQGQFQVTKLFEFVATAGGYLLRTDMRRWLLAGGVIDP